MLQPLFGRLVWLVILVAVLNGLVGLGFVALRAAGLISGSWLAVLSPLWAPLAVAVVLEIVLLQIIWACTAGSRSRRPRRASADGR
jgi:hypothetical protein